MKKSNNAEDKNLGDYNCCQEVKGQESPDLTWVGDGENGKEGDDVKGDN